MSIRLRLTLWYSGILAVTMVILGTAIYFFVNYNTYGDIKEQLKSQAHKIRAVPISNLDIVPFVSLQYEGVFIQFVNYNTREVFPLSDTIRRFQLQLPYPSNPSGLKEGFADMMVEGFHFLSYQVPLRMEAGGDIVGLIQVAYYTDQQEQYLSSLRTILVFTSIVAIFLAFTLGLFLARKALRPIEDVIRATNRIENGSNLSVRIPRGAPNDELGQLTDTLNGMLERLEKTYNDLDDAYKAQRRFVSDASHELRTPLTTIRGNIDLLEKMWRPELAEAFAASQGEGGKEVVLSPDRAELSLEAMKDISDEAKRMSRLVADMLSLARADAGYEMEKEPIELLPLVEEVARRANLLPRTADWRIGDLSSIEDVQVMGNADYLRQLIFIFIENAFKYTAEGYVELKAMRVDGQGGLIIQDTGIGMDNDEVPHIFERFYRADESRGKTAGTGLGLSIAKWIIDEHNGSVEVKTREGEGTTFIVWLPVFFPPQDDSGIMKEPDQH
ncbi:sensor histidine kinase [Paenibacillus tarimensis]|uniref:sensor histidine kinase n=1 Tax=Paenibacillus tarimensis TaxID=416012 RepID=UPI001F2DA807|nr:HAMP domain-containing sensor histidine kinase [Paenibacillus tarimensis]MCF2943821.1 HAMP domain-containing histidine kinase [Paenibacillus tarimensis]